MYVVHGMGEAGVGPQRCSWLFSAEAARLVDEQLGRGWALVYTNVQAELGQRPNSLPTKTCLLQLPGRYKSLWSHSQQAHAESASILRMSGWLGVMLCV